MSVTDDALPESEGVDEPTRWGVVRRLAVDITPLRHSRDFRRLYFGDWVSLTGTQMTAVAVPVQMFAITGSTLAVGLLGLAALVPLVVFGLLGGTIADAFDRRRVLLVTALGLAATSVLLYLQAVADLRSPALLYLLVAAQAALFAVDSPTRRSVTPRLLPAAQIPAATALGQVMFSLGVVVGPLLAGLLIGAVGFRGVYLLDVVSFAAVLYAVHRLPSITPEGGGRAPGIASLLEGLRYLRSRTVVLMTFVTDINAMVFGMPRALFPALAIGRYGGGPRTVGLLYAAPAMGALVGALLSGWSGRVRRQGLAVLVSIAAWGIAIIAFGLTRSLLLACLFLACAGAADMVSAVFRSSILQVATPDELRGRLSGVFIVVVAGGPRLGDLEAGAVASLSSPTFSVISGGVACVVGVVLLGWFVPAFRRYETPAGDAA